MMHISKSRSKDYIIPDNAYIIPVYNTVQNEVHLMCHIIYNVVLNLENIMLDTKPQKSKK